VFLAIAAFEFRHQTRQPIFWIAAVLFFLGAYGTMARRGSA
jgi:NADH:ubiquinone oxidoreductase subunit K